MERDIGSGTLRAKAAEAERELSGVKKVEIASAQDAVFYLKWRLVDNGYDRQKAERIQYNPKMLEAADHCLAMCEAEGIDPALYLRSAAETMGWFCVNKKIPFSPGFLMGGKSVDRYHGWIARNRNLAGRADLGMAESFKDERLEAEVVFVQVYYYMTAMRRPHRLSQSVRAAKKVDNSYSPSRSRRLIAMRDFFHSIQSSLPDRLWLRPAWTTKQVIEVAVCVTT